MGRQNNVPKRVNELRGVRDRSISRETNRVSSNSTRTQMSQSVIGSQQESQSRGSQNQVNNEISFSLINNIINKIFKI